MKKALALVLALVLALSMGVSAFAFYGLVPLDPNVSVKSDEVDVFVVDTADTTIYTYEAGEYYIALVDEDWKDVKVTANGNVTAELVKYDPAKMNVYGMEIVFDITRKGEAMGGVEYFTSTGEWVNGVASAKQPYQSTNKYDEALKYAAGLNKDGHAAYEPEEKVTYYDVDVRTNVNIIKITVEENYGVHFTEGSIVIEATLDKVPYKGVLTVINDVVIFEYEEVKWTANNFNADPAKSAALTVNTNGYSDYVAEIIGYDEFDEEYDEWENRLDEEAAVVSTTAFRAIEGKDLRIDYVPFYAYGEDDYELDVVLKDIVAGQKGVNFQANVYPVWEDDNYDNDWDFTEDLTSIEVEFLGKQVIKGEFEITIDLNCDWFELREYFGLKVEEDDIISYYLVDENGKVVGGKEIDYMTANVKEEAVFTVTGSNDTLGSYSLVLEVPSAEVGGESNPNTGAESVVGVVAALAVVSVATAAAVSLKK